MSLDGETAPRVSSSSPSSCIGLTSKTSFTAWSPMWLFGFWWKSFQPWWVGAACHARRAAGEALLYFSFGLFFVGLLDDLGARPRSTNCPTLKQKKLEKKKVVTTMNCQTRTIRAMPIGFGSNPLSHSHQQRKPSLHLLSCGSK